MLVFYFFSLILVFFGYRSLRGGINYLEYFKKELSQRLPTFTPFASVIVPCRGLDAGLEDNLIALSAQNYPKYEVIFVVDSVEDESVALIKKVSKKDCQSVTSRIVIAGNAIDSGQKVHNLRKAVLEISKESEVLVFIDSDARPNREWLRNLIKPLKKREIGCATGYRWFVQKKWGVATHLRSAWNASIASALGENMENNFCWGGSTAITRALFDRLQIREKWKGTLSDDFTLTNILKEIRMPIYFVPQCLTATVEDCGIKEMLEFTTRQMKITRVYSPSLWKISFVGSLIFVFTFYAGIILLFFTEGIHFWTTLIAVSVVFVLGVGKAWIRLSAVKLILTGYEKQLNSQFLPQVLFWTVTPILFLYNDIIAIFSRKITWRGITYELESANTTVIKKENG